MKKYYSTADIAVIGITLLLFVIALFMKGFTKEILIEAGIMLVSIKLILMNHKASISREKLMDELVSIKDVLKRMEKQHDDTSRPS